MQNTPQGIIYPPQNSLNKVRRAKSDLERIIENVLLTKDTSRNTKAAFMADSKKFLLWFKSTNHEPFSFDRCTFSDLLDFKKELLIRRYKPSTINRHISSLKTLFKTAHELGFIEKNLTDNLKLVQNVALAPKSLTEAEARRLMREVELRGNLRDQLIFSCFLWAGLRCSELVSLNHSDVHISPRSGFILIRCGKGTKSRKIPMNLKLRTVFNEFYEQQKELIGSHSRIFQGQRGDLTTLGVNKIVEKYARKAGLKTCPHQLRHTFAYSFLKKNPSDLVALSQILGHSNLNTTAIYTQNRFEDLESKVEKIV